MENFDNLVISLIDADANKGLFISELCRILNLPKICVGEIHLNTKLNNGVITQEVCVEMIDAEINKENLMKLPFKHIYCNYIVFEVGDTIL